MSHEGITEAEVIASVKRAKELLDAMSDYDRAVFYQEQEREWEENQKKTIALRKAARVECHLRPVPTSAIRTPV